MASRTISTVNQLLPGTTCSYIGAKAARFQISISRQRTGARMLRAGDASCYPPARPAPLRAIPIPCFERLAIMAEDEGAPDTHRPRAGNGNDTLPQVGVLAQYVKDLSFENPNAPAVYQWQSQPQMDVQFNIGTAGRRPRHARSLAEDRHHRQGRPRASPSASSCSMRACSRSATSRTSSSSPSCSPRRRACSSRSPARSSPTRRSTAASRRCCSTRSISPASTCRAPRSSRRKRPAARPGT